MRTRSRSKPAISSRPKPPNTFADGVACRVPNPDAFAMIRRGATRVIRVSDAEVKAAMRAYFADTHKVVEGAGAVPLAAAMREREMLRGKKIGLCSPAATSTGVSTRRFLAYGWSDRSNAFLPGEDLLEGFGFARRRRELQIDDRHEQQCQQQRARQAADHDGAERTLCLRARIECECERQHAGDHRARRHDDRPEPFERAFANSCDFVEPCMRADGWRNRRAGCRSL